MAIKWLYRGIICNFLLIATQLKIARKWNQPRCPSVDDRMKKSHIFVTEYYSAIKEKK